MSRLDKFGSVFNCSQSSVLVMRLCEMSRVLISVRPSSPSITLILLCDKLRVWIFVRAVRFSILEIAF